MTARVFVDDNRAISDGWQLTRPGLCSTRPAVRSPLTWLSDGYERRRLFLGHVYFVSDVQSVLDSWNVETVRDDFEHCIWRYRDVECLNGSLHCTGV